MVSFGTFLPKPCLFAVRWPNSWFSCLLGDDISDILVPGWWVGSFWACFAFFLLPLRFLYLPGRPSWMCLFDVAHFEFLIEIFKNFCNADCRTLQNFVWEEISLVPLLFYCSRNEFCSEWPFQINTSKLEAKYCFFVWFLFSFDVRYSVFCTWFLMIFYPWNI